MPRIIPAVSLLLPVLVACASAPPGPTDAEVRMELDSLAASLEGAVGNGNVTAATALFLADGRMVVQGVTGPDGPIDTEIVGVEQIRGFMSSIGAPPQFGMSPTGFTRSGDTATQTGTWSVDGGAQGGPFTLEWRRTPEGAWKIASWTIQGG